MDLQTLLETLRSAGARVVLITSFYKHLAPLEPERCLVAV
jgi:DNA-binding MurR/RpiR family transcriptional regulator